MMKKGVLITLVTILILLAFCLRPVDYTPYFETAYYKTTIHRLSQLVEEVHVSSGSTLEVGAGKAPIIPSGSTPLAGYIDRLGQPATGVHDSLFTRAIALKSADAKVVLISLDALIVNRKLAEAVMAQLPPSLGLQRHQVLFSATHTHCGPGAWGDSFLEEKFAGKYNQTTFDFLADQMAKAIEQACMNLKPAKAGFGSMNLPQYVKNRLVKDKGLVDPEFSYALFQQTQGQTIILGSYSAHAVTLSERIRQFSGDYPGYWVRRIESRFPGMAVFFAGGVGSHGPCGRLREFRQAEWMGTALADSISQALTQLRLGQSFPLLAMGLVVELPQPHIRITDGWRLAPFLTKKLLKEKNTYLQLITLGKTFIIGTPGDFSGELASELKDYAYRKGYRAILTSFNGSYVGYILPSKYYHLDNYESRLMSFYGPTMGDYIPDVIRRMMDVAMKKMSNL
ncbi:MAG: neutral/alkaline non-lysosomal ceramidase N-terminal domain-containing protein [candidate division KSB1 bacterium]|nr:neutral/alkaline non-lysosomal ceramidase N-terminal domain-containing protein [candidate division KSB1 bacterium]